MELESVLERRHTGRLRKRYNLLTGDKILSGMPCTRTHLPAGSLPEEDEVLALSVPDGGLVEGQGGGASRAELSWILQHRYFCIFFWRDGATNLATHLEVTKD
jgi:hypothetical protein